MIKVRNEIKKKYQNRHEGFAKDVEGCTVDPLDDVGVLLDEFWNDSRFIGSKVLVLEPLSSPGPFFVGHAHKALPLVDHSASDGKCARVLVLGRVLRHSSTHLYLF
jgi:hypothetical protein